jgi:hypothetical protein
MQHDKLNFFAELVDKYGIIKVSISMLFAAIAITFPVFITWLKDLSRKSDEKKLFNILIQLGEDVKTIAKQYSESISISMSETLLETTYKKEFYILYDFVREIIEKNDINNDRESIEERIKMQIKVAFKAISNDLIKFKYKNRSLSDFLLHGTWEDQIYLTLSKAMFENKSPANKKITNVRSYLDTEFGNIHFLTMQNINNF